MATHAADQAFADSAWLSEVGGGLPVVVKGVLRGDDAAACRAHGAAAVIVSNHGGRQLDGALPAALALPEVATALRESGAADGHAGCEVYADGGIRTRDDALTAPTLRPPSPWALARCSSADPRCGPSPAAARRASGPFGGPHRRPGPRHGPGRRLLSGRHRGHRAVSPGRVRPTAGTVTRPRA